MMTIFEFNIYSVRKFLQVQNDTLFCNFLLFSLLFPACFRLFLEKALLPYDVLHHKYAFEDIQ